MLHTRIKFVKTEKKLMVALYQFDNFELVFGKVTVLQRA